jgi:hypothetical protein
MPKGAATPAKLQAHGESGDPTKLLPIGPSAFIRESSTFLLGNGLRSGIGLYDRGTFLSYQTSQTNPSQPKAGIPLPQPLLLQQRRLLEGSSTRISASINMLITSADEIPTEERPLQPQDGAQPRESLLHIPCLACSRQARWLSAYPSRSYTGGAAAISIKAQHFWAYLTIIRPPGSNGLAMGSPGKATNRCRTLQPAAT